jgi:hypothetical protein
VTNDFFTEFENELGNKTKYPNFESIYWTESTDFNLYRQIDSSTFSKYFRTESGVIYTWGIYPEVKYYIMGQLIFQDGYTGLIICANSKFTDDRGNKINHFTSDICLFNKDGDLSTNHEFSAAHYQNDTLLWGGYSSIDTINNSLIYKSTISKENPYTHEEILDSDYFDFQAFDKDWKTVDLILKN